VFRNRRIRIEFARVTYARDTFEGNEFSVDDVNGYLPFITLYFSPSSLLYIFPRDS
jgi:hypothetical protein